MRPTIRPLWSLSLAWALTLALWGGLHQAQPARALSAVERRPNVILILVDSVRADHVSGYGYGRQTTPILDQLMAEGVRFTQATSSSAWTFPATAALLSGRSPDRLQTVWSDPAASIPTETVMLAEYLGEAGYATAGFVSAHFVGARFGFDQGFDIYDQAIRPNRDKTWAPTINARAMAWIDANWTAALTPTQPLFLFLYYYDPHTWYNPPPPFDTLYDATYTGTLTAERYGDGHDVVSGAIVPTERDVAHLHALYDGSIRYWDGYLGEMLAYLEERGVLEQSIVIVTSDHGEMFGEHGKWAHRNSLYEEVLRVPLSVRYSGVITPGLVVDVPVQTMDITPSVLDWVGLPVANDLDGLPLGQLLAADAAAMQRPIYSEMDAITDSTWPGYWVAPRFPLHALRQGDGKYILQRGLPYSDQFFDLQPASLYEVENLVASRPQEAVLFRQSLVERYGLPNVYLFIPGLME